MSRPRPGTLAGLALVSAAFVALVWIGMTGAVVYYVTPSELAGRPAAGALRLYGIVVPGSVRWDRGASTLAFRVTDGTTAVEVITRSLPTGLFREGIGVVLSGRATRPGAFTADEVLVKHSSDYAPLAPGETPPPGLLEMLSGAGR